jgi:hypothetical protein
MVPTPQSQSPNHLLQLVGGSNGSGHVHIQRLHSRCGQQQLPTALLHQGKSPKPTVSFTNSMNPADFHGELIMKYILFFHLF